MSGSGLILRLRMDPLVCSRLTRGKLLSCIPQDMAETGLEADGIHRGQLPNAILHMLHCQGWLTLHSYGILQSIQLTARLAYGSGSDRPAEWREACYCSASGCGTPSDHKTNLATMIWFRPTCQVLRAHSPSSVRSCCNSGESDSALAAQWRLHPHEGAVLRGWQ